MKRILLSLALLVCTATFATAAGPRRQGHAYNTYRPSTYYTSDVYLSPWGGYGYANRLYTPYGNYGYTNLPYGGFGAYGTWPGYGYGYGYPSGYSSYNYYWYSW